MNFIANVILVDNDTELLTACSQTLELANCTVQTFTSAKDALKEITSDFAGIVISDIRMPEIDGLEFFQRIQQIDVDIPVILITGHGDISLAVKSIQQGVYDFIAKPFAADHLIQSVKRAQNQRNLVLENRNLKNNLANNLPLVGQSKAMQKLRSTIVNLAPTDADILLIGETGSGKEVVANALHNLSKRANRQMVTLNCGALPESILESELFGHEAGSFTGANKKRVGIIAHANGGTLFLDEVESMPFAAQVRLLRVLEQREIMPVGSNQVIKLDLRIIAASKIDLLALCKEGKFREDLYYRLQVITIQIPPLRTRTEDIMPLFRHFMAAAAQKFNLKIPNISSDIEAHLLQHDWLGNVRELLHFAERTVLGVVNHQHSNDDFRNLSLPHKLEHYEKLLIHNALQENKGDISKTLAVLKIPRKTFYDKLSKYQITRADYLTKANR